MQSINIYKVKSHLSSLVDKVAKSGEAFIIARAGKPVAKVVPTDSQDKKGAATMVSAGKCSDT